MDAHLSKVLQHPIPSLADCLLGWHSQPCLTPRIAADTVGRTKIDADGKLGQIEERWNETANIGDTNRVICNRIRQLHLSR